MIGFDLLGFCALGRRNTPLISVSGVLTAEYAPTLTASIVGGTISPGTLNATYNPTFVAEIIGLVGKIGTLDAIYAPTLTAVITGSLSGVWSITAEAGAANIDAAPSAPLAPTATAGDGLATLN